MQHTPTGTPLARGLSATLLAVLGAATACGADRYDPVSRQLTIPSLTLGNATYSNVVVVISGIVSGPTGPAPYGSADSYEPASGRITLPEVDVGGQVYFNTVGTVERLVSIGSVAGADTYDGTNLNIASVRVTGGATVANVVARVTRIVSSGGGMPASDRDVYDPASNRLTIAAIQLGGIVYTNAIVAVGQLVSVAGSPPAVCPAPFGADTRATTVTVGSGTAASCTEAAFAGAVARGGVIRFNCGGPATIGLTSQKSLRTDINTTIDGEGRITLDGHGTTRLLYFNSPNFQATKTTVTIQNLTLQNGTATGTPIAAAPPPCSQGTQTDGGGGAVYVRDGILHVWNVVFRNNTGAAVGPDVAGGAVYALGSLGTTIVGSTFESNRAANGGAVGALFGDLGVYNSRFSSNQATGNGANTINASCTVKGGESGNGGNGGALYMDGGESYAVNVCGSTFTSNAGGDGAFGGAIFRTPDGAMQTTTIDRSSFIANTAHNGGALYFHNSSLVMTASTLSGNVASAAGGGLFADGSTLAFTNDTFADNVAGQGLGGSILLFGNGGTLQNVTFLGNQATGGAGYFGAAIAGGTPLTISNSLFADNSTDDCNSPMACAAGKSSGLHDLQWPATHTACTKVDVACTSGTTFGNPDLAALTYNGGPTPTAAPGPGSPALGLGQNCPATDQRGAARPANGCTAGAFEGAAPP